MALKKMCFAESNESSCGECMRFIEYYDTAFLCDL